MHDGECQDGQCFERAPRNVDKFSTLISPPEPELSDTKAIATVEVEGIAGWSIAYHAGIDACPEDLASVTVCHVEQS